jgi:nucleoside triphosphatase
MLQLDPEATVGALVVNPRGEVLIVRSSKWGNKLTVPGGHIKLGEHAEERSNGRSKRRQGLTLSLLDCC